MMIHVVTDKLNAVEALCRRYNVQRLALFGSAVRQDFDAKQSDLDFLVEFVSLSPGDKAEAYLGLLLALEDLFGRPVDLVERGAVRNPYVHRTIERQETLYAAA